MHPMQPKNYKHEVPMNSAMIIVNCLFQFDLILFLENFCLLKLTLFSKFDIF